MLLRIKHWLSFIGRVIERWTLWMQQGQGRWVLPRSNLYRSCSTLSMELFLQCLCDGNLKALIIEGGATDEELQEAWLIILSEYHELKGDIQGSEQWRLSIEVMRL